MDWWQVSVRGVTPDEVMACLEPETTWRTAETGAFGYAVLRMSDGGVRVMHTDDRPEVHIQMSGTAVRLVEEERLRGLTDWALGQDGHFSRFDTQVTLPYEVAEVEDVLASIDRGEFVGHARTLHAMSERDLRPRRSHEQGGGRAQPPPPCSRLGRSLYIGAAKSRGRLVVYDKGAESEGAIEGTRFELRERNERAQAAAQQFAEGEMSGSLWAGRVVTVADFREPARGEVTRWAAAPWWESIIGEAVRLEPYPPRVERTPEQVAEWMTKYQAPTFAALVAGGYLDAGEFERAGLERLRTKHERLMA